MPSRNVKPADDHKQIPNDQQQQPRGAKDTPPNANSENSINQKNEESINDDSASSNGPPLSFPTSDDAPPPNLEDLLELQSETWELQNRVDEVEYKIDQKLQATRKQLAALDAGTAGAGSQLAANGPPAASSLPVADAPQAEEPAESTKGPATSAKVVGRTQSMAEVRSGPKGLWKIEIDCDGKTRELKLTRKVMEVWYHLTGWFEDEDGLPEFQTPAELAEGIPSTTEHAAENLLSRLRKAIRDHNLPTELLERAKGAPLRYRIRLTDGLPTPLGTAPEPNAFTTCANNLNRRKAQANRKNKPR